MTIRHMEDELAGFALGALEPHEDEVVRTHLAECSECSVALAEARETLAVLPESLEPMAPYPGVKEVLLSAARADLDEIGISPQRLRVERSAAHWWGWGAAAAAFVVLAGALLWAIVLQSRLDDREEALVATQKGLAALVASERILHMESQYDGADVEAVIGVPDPGNPVTVVVTGLPEAADGHGYRLWLFKDGEASGGVTLAPDADGNVVAQLELDLSDYEAMELDAQPLGDDAPGGELVLGGPLR